MKVDYCGDAGGGEKGDWHVEDDWVKYDGAGGEDDGPGFLFSQLVVVVIVSTLIGEAKMEFSCSWWSSESSITFTSRFTSLWFSVRFLSSFVFSSLLGSDSSSWCCVPLFAEGMICSPPHAWLSLLDGTRASPYKLCKSFSTPNLISWDGVPSQAQGRVASKHNSGVLFQRDTFTLLVESLLLKKLSRFLLKKIRPFCQKRWGPFC